MKNSNTTAPGDISSKNRKMVSFTRSITELPAENVAENVPINEINALNAHPDSERMPRTLCAPDFSTCHSIDNGVSFFADLFDDSAQQFREHESRQVLVHKAALCVPCPVYKDIKLSASQGFLWHVETFL